MERKAKKLLKMLHKNYSDISYFSTYISECNGNRRLLLVLFLELVQIRLRCAFSSVFRLLSARLLIRLDKMGRGQDLSLDLRKSILKLHLENKSYREIGRIIGKSPSTIHSVIKKYLNTGELAANHGNSGRPKILTPREERKIVSTVLQNPRTTSTIIRKNVEEATFALKPSETACTRPDYMVELLVENHIFLPSTKKNVWSSQNCMLTSRIRFGRTLFLVTNRNLTFSDTTALRKYGGNQMKP